MLMCLEIIYVKVLSTWTKKWNKIASQKDSSDQSHNNY